MIRSKRKTRVELERRIIELEAQMAHVPRFTIDKLNEATINKMKGSAVIVQLYAFGGREICSPFAIRDGLSDETIKALCDDLIRTYELATMYKPKQFQGKQS